MQSGTNFGYRASSPPTIPNMNPYPSNNSTMLNQVQGHADTAIGNLEQAKQMVSSQSQTHQMLTSSQQHLDTIHNTAEMAKTAPAQVAQAALVKSQATASKVKGLLSKAYNAIQSGQAANKIQQFTNQTSKLIESAQKGVTQIQSTLSKATNAVSGVSRFPGK